MLAFTGANVTCCRSTETIIQITADINSRANKRLVRHCLILDLVLDILNKLFLFKRLLGL